MASWRFCSVQPKPSTVVSAPGQAPGCDLCIDRRRDHSEKPVEKMRIQRSGIVPAHTAHRLSTTTNIMTIKTPSGCNIARSRPEVIAMNYLGRPRPGQAIARASQVVPGNVDQIALLHVVPAAQPDPAHATAIEDLAVENSDLPDGLIASAARVYRPSAPFSH